MNTIDSIRDAVLKKQEQICQIQKETENLEKELKKLVEEEEKLRLDLPVSIREFLKVTNQMSNFSSYSQQGLPMTYYPANLTDDQITTMNNELKTKWNHKLSPVETTVYRHGNALKPKKNTSDNPEPSPLP